MQPINIDMLHAIKEYESKNSTIEQVSTDIAKIDELIAKMTKFERDLTKTQVQDPKQQLAHLSNILTEIPSPISRTSSSSITSSLQAAIDQYGNEIADLVSFPYGPDVFEQALDIILDFYDSILIGNGTQADMLQAIVIKMLSDPNKYPLVGQGGVVESDIELIFQTGSGTGQVEPQSSHNTSALERVTIVINQIVTLVNNGAVPQDNPVVSVLERLIGPQPFVVNSHNIRARAENIVRTREASGSTINGAERLAPNLRLILLESLASQELINAQEARTLLTADLADLSALLQEKVGVSDPFDYIQSLDAGWTRISNAGDRFFFDGYGSSNIGSLNDGIDELVVVSEEKLKQINSLGDGVRIVAEALKQWLTLNRENLLAAMRNI